MENLNYCHIHQNHNLGENAKEVHMFTVPIGEQIVLSQHTRYKSSFAKMMWEINLLCCNLTNGK